jgi:hypothetical protein
MTEDRGGGCLLEALMAIIITVMGAFTGFSVSVPPPDNFTQVYTFHAEASPEDLRAAQEVLVLRLEKLLQLGQISRYEALDMTTDGEIQVAITGQSMEQGALVEALTRIGLLELVDLSGLSSDVQVEGVSIESLAGGDATLKTILTNADIAAATVVDDGIGGFVVQIDFTPQAAEIMGAFTETHVGERLAIVIDGVVLSAPTIHTRIDESAWISGNFTEVQAQAIAVQVGTPPLPVALEVARIMGFNGSIQRP